MSYQRDFSNKLSVGLVGVGSHAYRNILPAMTFLPVELKAFCDVDLDLARITAHQYGVSNCYQRIEEMLTKECLDAVFIAAPPRLHPQLTIQALDAGLHVWLEKPPAMRAEQVQQMIERQNGKVVVVRFKKVFMPSTRKVIEILNQSEFGQLKSMLAVYPMTIPPDGEKILAEHIHTNWLQNGCHPLSLMLAVGGTVDSVSTHRGKNGGGVCILSFDSGAVGNLHLAAGGGSGQPIEQYSFFGDSSQATIDNNLRITWQRGIPFQYTSTTDYVPKGFDSGAIIWEPQNGLATLENKALFTQGFYHEINYFCQCILSQTPAQIGSLKFAFHLMEVYESALLSKGKLFAIGK